MNIQMSCKASFQDNCESNLEEKEIETSLSNKSTSLDFSDSESELDGYLTPFNSLESLSVDEAETPKITDEIIDKIISFFKVKRPVRFIDKETKEDEVTYEESEIRLVILMILSAIILTLVNTSLAGFTILSMFNKETLKNPWDPIISNSVKGSFPTSNVIVIDRNGNLESLQLQNQNILKESYKMKLPKSDKGKNSTFLGYPLFSFIFEGYFPFEEKGDVYIVKSKGVTTDNGKKLITKISSNGHHRVIKSNELPKRFTSEDTTSFRLGKLFWLVGQPDQFTSSFIPNPNLLESWIFSIEKQRWFKGPFSFEWEDPCGVPLNRTFGLILYKTFETSTWIGYYLFNFDETFAFTNNNSFLDIMDGVLNNRPPSCTSMVDKNGSM